MHYLESLENAILAKLWQQTMRESSSELLHWIIDGCWSCQYCQQHSHVLWLYSNTTILVCNPGNDPLQANASFISIIRRIVLRLLLFFFPIKGMTPGKFGFLHPLVSSNAALQVLLMWLPLATPWWAKKFTAYAVHALADRTQFKVIYEVRFRALSMHTRLISLPVMGNLSCPIMLAPIPAGYQHIQHGQTLLSWL